jgi:hypothetical protein
VVFPLDVCPASSFYGARVSHFAEFCGSREERADCACNAILRGLNVTINGPLMQHIFGNGRPFATSPLTFRSCVMLARMPNGTH